MIARAPELRNRWRAISVVLAVMAGLGPAAPASAGPSTITFQIEIGSTCAYGLGPQDTDLTVTLRSASGKRLDRVQTHSDETTGSFQACFDQAITPGRKVTARTASDQRTITVPTFDAHLGRVSNVLRGHAAATDQVFGTAATCTPSACKAVTKFTIPVNAKGGFRRDLSPVDVDGSDFASLFDETEASDSFSLRSSAPFFEAREFGPAKVLVHVDHAGPVTLQLRAGGGGLRATASKNASRAGGYDLTFRHDGHAVAIKAGNHIIGNFASDAEMVVPPLALDLDAGADTIAGHCFPDQGYFVQIQKSPSSFTSFGGTAGADGSFEESTPLDTGDKVFVDCEDRHGDQVRLKGTVP